MIYDFDKRDACKGLVERMNFELPFTSFMPDEYRFSDTDVRFVYSDLGISRDKMEKLMQLTVRHNGIDRKLAYVTVLVVTTDEWDDVDELFVTIKHTVAVFE